MIRFTHDLNCFDGNVSHSWICEETGSLPNSVELELWVVVQLDVHVRLISNNYSMNEVALFVERGSTHALETVVLIGKQLHNINIIQQMLDVHTELLRIWPESTCLKVR